MAQGFVVDRGNVTQYVSAWAPGAPEASFWSGTKTEATIPIGAFRCERCGFLEYYARAEFEAT